MNDRFKFRVWSIANKKYCHFATMDLSADGLLRVIRPLEQSEYIDDYENRYVIQQCTGLKDKNGKLIYEGDILKELYTDDDGIKEYFSIVKWHIGSAGFVMYDVDYKIDYTYFNEFDVNLDNFEIVGNIYENSDFLNKRGKNE